MANIRSVWDQDRDKEKKQGGQGKDKKFEMFTDGHGQGQSATGTLRPVRGNKDPDELRAILEQAVGKQPGQADGSYDRAIVLYKNGFKIGDGPFRDRSDPQNAKFLAEIRAGHVPQELEAEFMERFGPEAKAMGINLVNKTQEEYVPPPKQFQAFEGEGHGLGGGGIKAGASFAECEAKEVTVDEAQPTTTVQVILHGGKRIRLKLNLSTSVLELYAHVKAASGYGGTFDLLAGFPPAALTDPSQTVKDAGLAGSRITQKVS